VPFDPGLHDPDEAFEAVASELVRGYEAATGSDLGWVVEQILEFRWTYFGGNLATWTADEVTTLLFDLYPARTTLGAGELPDVIKGFAGLLRYLGDVGLASPAKAQRLALLVEGSAREFEAAMADESRYSSGKRLVMAMLADGVDLADRTAVDAWTRAFNERSFDERVKVVGPPPDAGRPLPWWRRERPGALEGVVVSLEREALEQKARESVLLQRTQRLVEFVGEKRALTDKGNLSLGDARELIGLLGTPDVVEEVYGDRVFRRRSSTELPGVDLPFRLALAAGLLEQPSVRRVRPGPRASLPAQDPLEAIARLLAAWLADIGPTTYYWGENRYGFGFWAEVIDEELAEVLADLCVAGEAVAVEIDEIADELWGVVLDSYDLDDLEPHQLEFQPRLLNSAIRRVFGDLELLGVLAVSGVREQTTEYGTTEEAGGVVTITPLGAWVMRHIAVEVVEVSEEGVERNGRG
jgi:hypothetical protein